MSDKSTILIVDDEPDVLDAVRRSIYNKNYTFVTTTSANEAAQILAERDIDVLLSDVDMPEMSGHELMVKARQIRPTAVRILITGRGTLESAMAGINQGEIYRFVTKPFDPSELKAVVKEALERKDELALVSEATANANRKRLFTEQLEAEHPGITQFKLDRSGAYPVDVEACKQAAKALGLAPFF